ncbi:hypothetical protein RFI_26097 [Reticulomyxa filosa]|uniref:Transmembrane protein n=1 Tax=Reticulomyxa filosa TaxID=46433 RepID=X6MC86_RETFI|nr:hypothetical protein RFI_26097 [Reticulomyxa filosa]|eukprot:ETO11276.1 hypothetical protein RFI_26097 [Reticulomyxa filosa]
MLLIKKIFLKISVVLVVFKGLICFVIMLVQLQQNFSEIDQEVISQTWNYFNENLAETKDILTLLTKNTLQKILCCLFLVKNIIATFFTNLEQQSQLMKLFNHFGNKIEKRTILQTWIDCNQIYIETWLKLMEIFIFFMKYVLFKNKNEYKYEFCQQLNDRLKEDNELKILREMCLHILWNILKYPNELKYRQINGQCLFNNLKLKCQRLGVNVNQTSNHFQSYLQALGFEKRNENWYYPNDDTQLAWSWEYYKEFINQQACMLICTFAVIIK